MGRITTELVLSSPAFINPLREREIDMRGNKIPRIENLGAAEDQFDTIDLSDNTITKLEGFPLMNRMRTLLLSNNQIKYIADGLGASLPNLESIILTNNLIEELGEIDSLTELENLRTLSLLKNPVTNQEHYRLYVIHRIPQLKILDFQKIKLAEREQAEAIFRGEEGDVLREEIQRSRQDNTQVAISSLSQEQIEIITKAIDNLPSREEAIRLEQILQSGKITPSLLNKLGITDT
eukprot:TRINITY_DN5372_c0_g1_i2.p1 TRINITY_DN5372_c0_g1~~TRINITY_DN5372_c0_g1_i2.p1  ORF type:complete len:236 (+),score=63.38 TRINITY_DN5372_c0_g1_i2:24-731(+)